jgi:hypothetical protein
MSHEGDLTSIFFAVVEEVMRLLSTDGKTAGRLPVDVTPVSRQPVQGRIRIGGLLLLLLSALAATLGVQALTAYADYLALADTVRLVIQDISLGPQRVEEGEQRILAKARELHVPLSDREVVVQAAPGKLSARVKWQQSIGLWGYTIPLTFEINESRSL